VLPFFIFRDTEKRSLLLRSPTNRKIRLSDCRLLPSLCLQRLIHHAAPGLELRFETGDRVIRPCKLLLGVYNSLRPPGCEATHEGCYLLGWDFHGCSSPRRCASEQAIQKSQPNRCQQCHGKPYPQFARKPIWKTWGFGMVRPVNEGDRDPRRSGRRFISGSALTGRPPKTGGRPWKL
jgi:hypothetical protein